MRALVTGTTGLVGHRIAMLLTERGYEVTGLVRDVGRAERMLPGVTLKQGDVTRPGTLREAMHGIDWVFHSAGLPEHWQRDPSIFDRVNRAGTRNVLEAALAAGVKRAVYTSTMDVFAAATGGTLVETRLDDEPKPTVYEQSKVDADREAERVRGRGLDVVHVCPSAVYGPSPVHVGLNSFFIRLLNRKAPVLPPGGMSVLFVEGCAEAHLAAAERGRSGERYLVADGYATNVELAELARAHSDLTRIPPTAPTWLVKGLAVAGESFARITGKPPLLTKGQLAYLLWNVRIDTGKAQRELGFEPTPLADGVARTIAFLRNEGLVP